jgi:hypothetical protein
VQYYCTTALSNIAVDANNRRKLAQTEPRLVQSLVNLMDSSSPKVQCQAALALRNLASDEKYQLEIVRANGLGPLLRLLQSSYLPLILSAVACIRNISIHPLNESPIIEAGFLKPLVDLLGQPITRRSNVTPYRPSGTSQQAQTGTSPWSWKQGLCRNASNLFLRSRWMCNPK